MNQCRFCFAWKPTQFNGFGYDDTVAKCSIRMTEVEAQCCCEYFSKINPSSMSSDTRAGYYKKVGEALPNKDIMPTGQPKQLVQTRTGTNVVETPMPMESLELRQHQKEAVDKLKDLDGGCLFMDMGCGKSATALQVAEVKYNEGKIRQLLVIAPNGVHSQWAKEEVPKWLSCGYEVQCIYGRGGNVKTKPFNQVDNLKVLCVNIDTFSTPHKWEEVVQWHNIAPTMVILDESTNIKNPQSKRGERIITGFNEVTKRGKYIINSVSKSVYRCILTGTPVTNSPLDLWAMMEFVKPNFFGRNYYSFRSYYCMMMRISIDRVGKVDALLSKEAWEAIKSVGDFGFAYARFGVSMDCFQTIMQQDKYLGPYKHLDELKKLLEPVAYFKNLKDVTDIAEPLRVVRKVPLSAEQERCYKDMVSGLASQYGDTEVTAANKLSAMVRLQQICSGFLPKNDIQPKDIYEEGLYVEERIDYNPLEVEWIGDTNPKLEELLRDIETCSKPCIVVTKFSCEADRIYNELKDKYECILYTGWKKTGSIEDFKGGKVDIMVANIASISHGFNLQNSCQMLFYSNTFSLERRLQCEGRIYRLGQDGVCQYVDYVMEDTIEELIMESLSRKSSLLYYMKGLTMKELFNG